MFPYMFLSLFEELPAAWSLLRLEWFKFICVDVVCCGFDEPELYTLLLFDDEDFLLLDFDGDEEDGGDFAFVVDDTLGLISKIWVAWKCCLMLSQNWPRVNESISERAKL